MIEVDIKEMMESGAHFGHQTKRWNPKMKPYIYGARSGVHILDLQKTKDLANEALKFVAQTVAQGASVLFVGTKPQAREVVKNEAVRCKMHFVNQRWMGGTLTNFKTIKKSIDRLIMLQTRRVNNDFEGYTKKELLDIDREVVKLEASLGGIKALVGAPGIVFVIDPNHEHIAILEAKKLGIPVVAITDSNCDPEPIDYIIPANDDAISSVEYFTKRIADAILEGYEKLEQHAREDDHDAEGRSKGPRRKRVAKGTEADKKGGAKTAYVSRGAPAPLDDGKNAEGFSAKVDEIATEESSEKLTTDEHKQAAVG